MKAGWEIIKRYRSVVMFAIFLFVGIIYLLNYFGTEKALKTERISKVEDVHDFWRYDPATHKYVSR